jgi:KaiC/GvpD/RAD55 family RecA-like ATPase
MGTSGIGKTIVTKQFILNGLLNGESCIYITTDESPLEVINSLERYQSDINEYIEKGLLDIVDCYSWKIGEEKATKTELTTISVRLEEVREKNVKHRIVLDSITGLASNKDSDQILKFIQIIMARIKWSNSKAIFTLASQAHSENFTSVLRLNVDGVIEMKAEENETGLTRLMRIFAMKGTMHKTSWIPYEITDKGIKILTENQERCILCSKPISWSPHIELINGKEYRFDKPECADTYRKLKEIYGDFFE